MWLRLTCIAQAYGLQSFRPVKLRCVRDTLVLDTGIGCQRQLQRLHKCRQWELLQLLQWKMYREHNKRKHVDYELASEINKIPAIEATANAKNKTCRRQAPTTGMTAGDLWFDS